MAIKNNKLGGTDYSTPTARVKPTDLNDTNDAIINTVIGHAQNAYQILQSNNIFENKDFLATDEFTDANGANNTINTGSTTAVYNSNLNAYKLAGNTGTAEDSTAVTTTDGTSSVISFDVDISATGFINQVEVDNNTVGTKVLIIKKNGTQVATIDTTATGDVTFTLVVGDYSSIFESGDTATVEITAVNGGLNYKNTYSYSGTDFSITNEQVGGSTGSSLVPVSFTDSTGFTSGTIVLADADTLTLDGTEKSICVYIDSINTSNTSLSVKAGDGTTQTSSQTITNNSSNVFNITSLSSGSLELEFTLTTTDTAETPEFFGYGVYLIK